MVGLHRCDNIQFLEPQNLLGRRDLRVLNTEAIIGAAIGGLGFGLFRGLFSAGECVERHLHAFVSDGMETDLIARQHPLPSHGIQFFGFILRNAGIARIVTVGRKQSRRLGPKRAIHKALEHSGVQHVVLGGM